MNKTERPSFNLIDHPWIPCLKPDGRAVELGLQDALLQAHTLREIHGDSPLEIAALYRLLLAILHRVFGPDSRSKWKNLWVAGKWPPGPLEAYFAKWQGRFDLFHPERPFYQAADPRVKPKSAINLVFHMASGNNPTLFDHHTEDAGVSLTPAQAARILVAAHSFGLSGICDPSQNMFFTQGSCTGQVIFIVEGKNLFESLALNLIRYPHDPYMVSLPEDQPAWEMENSFQPNRSTPLGYMDYLTWQNRRVILVPDYGPQGMAINKVTIAPGLTLSPDLLDTMIHYNINEKTGYRALSFTEDRSLWRDSVVLLNLNQPDKARPPVTINWLAGLVDEGILDRTQTYRFLGLGLATEKNKPAKVEFYRYERMPLPLEYLQNDDLLGQLSGALAQAEATGRQLWGALSTLASFALSPDLGQLDARKPDRKDISNLVAHWGAERNYWSELELPFTHLLTSLPTQGLTALESWRKILWRTVMQAFEKATLLESGGIRSLKAVVKARLQLQQGLAKTLPINETSGV